MAVRGFQLHVTCDLDFETIVNAVRNESEEFEAMSHEEMTSVIQEKRDDGALQDFLEQRFSAADLVRMANEVSGDRYPIQVGSGYYSH